MPAHAYDPDRLDVAAFAAAGGRLSGSWPGAGLARLAALQTLPQDALPDPVTWQCSGERRVVAGEEPEVWLRLQVQAKLWLTCQRCLQPMREALAVDRRIRFVRGEAAAEALDAECEHDVLALTRTLDLRELVEDEMLLALPLVPRHATCPQPLVWTPAPTEEPDTRSPFAGLDELRERRSGN